MKIECSEQKNSLLLAAGTWWNLLQQGTGNCTKYVLQKAAAQCWSISYSVLRQHLHMLLRKKPHLHIKGKGVT